MTGDEALERDFYATLKTYMDFYFPAGPPAVSSTGTPYWNESMGLLWTPNLEHSRLTKMWCADDGDEDWCWCWCWCWCRCRCRCPCRCPCRGLVVLMTAVTEAMTNDGDDDDGEADDDDDAGGRRRLLRPPSDCCPCSAGVGWAGRRMTA